MYRFLFWLDNFIYVREGRTNIQKTCSSDEEDEDDYELTLDNELDNDVIDQESDNEVDHSMNERIASSFTSPDPPQKPSSKRQSGPTTGKSKLNKEATSRSKRSKSEYLDEMEMNLIRDLGKSVKNDTKEKEPDEIDVYVKSLAVDLRKLSERDYFIVKHEFQGILFKYQMAQFNQGHGKQRPPSNNDTSMSQPNDGYYSRWVNN